MGSENKSEEWIVESNHVVKNHQSSPMKLTVRERSWKNGGSRLNLAENENENEICVEIP